MATNIDNDKKIVNVSSLEKMARALDERHDASVNSLTTMINNIDGLKVDKEYVDNAINDIKNDKLYYNDEAVFKEYEDDALVLVDAYSPDDTGESMYGWLFSLTSPIGFELDKTYNMVLTLSDNRKLNFFIDYLEDNGEGSIVAETMTSDMDSPTLGLIYDKYNSSFEHDENSALLQVVTYGTEQIEIVKVEFETNMPIEINDEFFEKYRFITEEERHKWNNKLSYVEKISDNIIFNEFEQQRAELTDDSIMIMAGLINPPAIDLSLSHMVKIKFNNNTKFEQIFSPISLSIYNAICYADESYEMVIVQQGEQFIVMLNFASNEIIEMTELELQAIKTSVVDDKFLETHRFITEEEREQWNNKADVSYVNNSFNMSCEYTDNAVEEVKEYTEELIQEIKTAENAELNTEDKTVIGAINEVAEGLFNVEADIIALDIYKADKEYVDNAVINNSKNHYIEKGILKGYEGLETTKFYEEHEPDIGYMYFYGANNSLDLIAGKAYTATLLFENGEELVLKECVAKIDAGGFTYIGTFMYEPHFIHFTIYDKMNPEDGSQDENGIGIDLISTGELPNITNIKIEGLKPFEINDEFYETHKFITEEERAKWNEEDIYIKTLGETTVLDRNAFIQENDMQAEEFYTAFVTWNNSTINYEITNLVKIELSDGTILSGIFKPYVTDANEIACYGQDFFAAFTDYTEFYGYEILYLEYSKEFDVVEIRLQPVEVSEVNSEFYKTHRFVTEEEKENWNNKLNNDNTNHYEEFTILKDYEDVNARLEDFTNAGSILMYQYSLDKSLDLVIGKEYTLSFLLENGEEIIINNTAFEDDPGLGFNIASISGTSHTPYTTEITLFDKVDYHTAEPKEDGAVINLMTAQETPYITNVRIKGVGTVEIDDEFYKTHRFITEEERVQWNKKNLYTKMLGNNIVCTEVDSQNLRIDEELYLIYGNAIELANIDFNVTNLLKLELDNGETISEILTPHNSMDTQILENVNLENVNDDRYIAIMKREGSSSQLLIQDNEQYLITGIEIQAIDAKEINDEFYETHRFITEEERERWNNNSNSKETLVNDTIASNVLTLTTDKRQKVEMIDGTEIVLPTVSDFTEIHLYFSTLSDLTLTFPAGKYQKTPEIKANKTYEFIFTYIGEWLIGYIEYGN